MGFNDAYRFSYATKKLGTICTGFTATIAGPGELPPNLSGAIKVGKGKEVSRDYEAETTTWADPMYKVLNKVCFMSNDKTIVKFPNGKNVFNQADVDRIFRKELFEKDASAFLRNFIPKEMFIVKDSSLASGGGESGRTRIASINQSRAITQIGQIVSTMDILQTYLPVMGLEMYWDDGYYSIESPRILNPDVIAGYVSEDDILSMNISEDIFNVPDLVVPKLNSPDILGKGVTDITMAKIISNIGDCAGSDNFKISTFDIPPVMANAFELGYEQFLAQKAHTTGVLKGKYNGVEKGIVSFYSKLGHASALYQIQSGIITTTFQEVYKAPAWYKIGGVKYFVSDIRHDVTRFREITTFTIAGTEDSLSMPSTCGSGSIDSPPRDDLFEDSIEKVKTKDKEAKAIRKEAKESEFYHPGKGKHKLESSGKWKKFKKILPNKTKIKEDVNGIAAERIPT